MRTEKVLRRSKIFIGVDSKLAASSVGATYRGAIAQANYPPSNTMIARDRILLPRWRIVLTSLMIFVYPGPWLVLAASAASSSLDKLFRVFVGDWTVSETFQKNEFFPKGGERKGEAHFTIGTGGTSLIEDYHSNGSAGKLDFLLVIWWDSEARVYKVFTCSNNPDNAGGLRGTARWEGDTLVNEYEETVNGKPLKFQDRFTKTSTGGITLVAGMVRAGKDFQLSITTTYKRKITGR